MLTWRLAPVASWPTLTMNSIRHPASFRDPAAYVFTEAGHIKRAITQRGVADYRLVMESGLASELHRAGLLIPHDEEARSASWPSDAAAVLVPEVVPFVSYPYEWSFGQLRDAALLTLDVQQRAMAHGLSLKDASAFNVQFRGSMPVFIDTLSFEPNVPGPWVAYHQFCRHFLAPLLMMRHAWPSAVTLLRAELDGLGLDWVSRALPRSTYLNFGCLVHIHLHARAVARAGRTGAAGDGRPPAAAKSSGAVTDRKAALISSLRQTVAALRPRAAKTEWSDYYADLGHYDNDAQDAKAQAVAAALDRLQPRLVYDLGGNTGVYSRLATARGAYTVSMDADPLCVHAAYAAGHRARDTRLLPLVMNLANPSPSLGFASTERDALHRRPVADVVMALALLHHLRISANAPFVRIAEYLARLGRTLIIEWVPRDDPKVEELLRVRPDTFPDYSEAGFLAAFGQYFAVELATPLGNSRRAIHVMRRREA